MTLKNLIARGFDLAAYVKAEHLSTDPDAATLAHPVNWMTEVEVECGALDGIMQEIENLDVDVALSGRLP